MELNLLKDVRYRLFTLSLCLFFLSNLTLAQTFTSGSGSIQVPPNANTMKIQVWGAGGNGGGRNGGRGASGGGGGGAYSECTIRVNANDVFYYQVGSTGGADSWVNSTNAVNNPIVLAKGGANVSVNQQAGGNGGKANDGVGAIKWDGGNGASGTGNNNGYGGGGGSSAGTSGNGNNAQNATGGSAPTNGGAGGAGRDGRGNGYGIGGGSPGGGGGGAKTNGSNKEDGGKGANGKIIITFSNTLVVNDDVFQTPQAVPVSGNVLANDIAGLMVVSATYKNQNGQDTGLNIGTATTVYDNLGVNAGTIQLNSDGSFLFTPQIQFAGQVYIVYTAKDGTGTTGSATLLIVVGTCTVATAGGGEVFGWTVNDANNGGSAGPHTGTETPVGTGSPSAPFANDETVSVTFDQQGTSAGYTLDIYKLDNSFNMKINGQLLAQQEIQFQTPAVSGAPNVNVKFAGDPTGFVYTDGTDGNKNIWQMDGDAQHPILRVMIAPTGKVTLLGTRSDDPAKWALEPLELIGGNLLNPTIFWKAVGTNEIRVTQYIDYTTSMSGAGYGNNYTNSGGSCVCTKPGFATGTEKATQVGITLLNRAGDGNWPASRKGGFIALESNSKGFVITRMASDENTGSFSGITNPVDGMIVYDTRVNCIKIYTTSQSGNGQWKCFDQPACPDN